MNEQTRFETEVRAYLHAQGSGEAPADLLARGMSGVRHTAQRRTWMSRLSGSWVLPSVGAAAVAATALLVAVLIGLLPPAPIPVGPSPSSSGSPGETPCSLLAPDYNGAVAAAFRTSVGMVRDMTPIKDNPQLAGYADSDPAWLCYIDGEIPKAPASGAPSFDRALLVVVGNQSYFIAAGYRQTMPVETPAPTPSVAPSPVAVPALPGFTTDPPTAPNATWTALTWRKLAADDPLAQVRQVIRWSGGYIALGQDQAAGDRSWTPVWISADGTAWTSLDPAGFGAGTIVFDVAALPHGGVVALTGAGWADGLATVPAQSWTSSDGRTWTAHPGPAVIAQAGLQSYERPMLATGPGGVIASASWRATTAAISSDGISWTPLPDTALPSGFALGGMTGTAAGYLAVGAVPSAESPEALTGIALSSPDGLHWTSVALPDPDARGLPWGADGLFVGSNGFIAHGSVFAAPGAEVWWQSSDGRHWRLLPDFAPLGVSPTPVGRGADGMLLSDGSRILAVRFDAAWVSLDGRQWSRVAVPGEPPAADSGAVALFPGGALLVENGADGWTGWWGEASGR